MPVLSVQGTNPTVQHEQHEAVRCVRLCVFFYSVQGTNPIYNLLPDILSSLSAEPGLPSAHFQVPITPRHLTMPSLQSCYKPSVLQFPFVHVPGALPDAQHVRGR